MPFAPPETKASYAPDTKLCPVHISAKLDFDLSKKRLVARVATLVKGNVAGARSLPFDGVGFSDVRVQPADEAEGGNGGAVEEWSYDGRELSVCWRRPFEAGETRLLTVDYTVEQPVTALMFFAPDDKYPHRPSLAVTFNEPERARYWLLCVDKPAIRTTFDFYITVPGQEGTEIVANGLLQSETVDAVAGTKTAHWRLDQPCPSYLTCVAAGELIKVSNGSLRDIPFVYYAPKGHNPENLLRSFGKTGDTMRWMERRLGNSFPYPKYFQLCHPQQGGAMEHISLTTWDEVFINEENWAREFQLDTVSVNCHEMAHSYFGDSVVIRHFEHVWLKESWATYMEVVYMEDFVGKEQMEYELWSNATAYFQETESYTRPIVCRHYDTSWSLFDRHTYPGGGWRLHMLRRLLGDGPFWAAVAEYLREHMHGPVVETDDFRKKLESHGHINLTKFFDQWVYGEGYPKVKGSYTWNAEKKEAKLVFEQTQEKGPFDVELDVALTMADGTVVRTTVEFDGKRGVSVLSLASAPAMIAVDADHRLLFSLEFNPGQSLLETAAVKGDLFTRMRAYSELVKVGSRSALSKVLEAAGADGFYGARSHAVDALSRAPSNQAIEAAATLLLAESDPRAQSEMLLSLLGQRVIDARLRTALLEYLNRPGPLPYRATARCLELLGVQHCEEDFPLLQQMANDNGHMGIVRSGALRGIGHLRLRESYELLKARLPYGADRDVYRVRESAVQAFTTAATWQPENVRKDAIGVLTGLLRDPQERVYTAAASGLVTLKATAAIPALEALKSFVSAQKAAWLDRQIRSLRATADASSSRKEIEELQKKVNKLSEEVQDLKALVDKKQL